MMGDLTGNHESASVAIKVVASLPDVHSRPSSGCYLT